MPLDVIRTGNDGLEVMHLVHAPQPDAESDSSMRRFSLHQPRIIKNGRIASVLIKWDVSAQVPG